MSGAQPIAIADVTAFCALAGMTDPTQRMELLHCVQAMDAEFMSIVAERQKAEQRKRKGKGRK